MVALKLFYSYSHRDEQLMLQLADHLSLLRREGLIDDWNDRRLVAGEEWDDEIKGRLNSADLVLLLVSSSFISSKFCWDVEMTSALARDKAGTTRVVPIIVRPSDWKQAPFATLQTLPKDARPVTTWSNRDEAWLNVVTGLRAAITAVANSASRATSTPPHDPGRTRRSRSKSDAGGDGGLPVVQARTVAPTPGFPQRQVFDAGNLGELPGRLARDEGAPITGDESVDRVYDYLGDAYRFLWEVFGHDSFDGRGARLLATVHYERAFQNAFWNGQQVVLGDGGGSMSDLARLFDVTVKEVMNGVVQQIAGLDYQDQSGALYNAAAVVFTVLARQWLLHETADEADWLFGRGFWTPAVKGTALSSLAAPGSAYDDEAIGRDPQQAHMDHYVTSKSDSGGVHTNSGIPAHAFYRLATALGGRSWEKAGRIWFDAFGSDDLPPDASFAAFAGITVSAGGTRYGPDSAEVRAVRQSWTDVGIDPDGDG